MSLLFDDTFYGISKGWDSALNIHDYSIDDLHFPTALRSLCQLKLTHASASDTIAALKYGGTKAAATSAWSDDELTPLQLRYKAEHPFVTSHLSPAIENHTFAIVRFALL
jgi:hypothetical protein